MRGYDYGFTDSINFAFYNEMKLIKSKVRKLRFNKISNLEIIKNNKNNINSISQKK